ncbi:MAG: WXG100 family type VII secretion target [Lachnospiraceae bacterium]
MAIIGTVELLVTPEVLHQKATEVEDYVKMMQQRFDTMNILVEKSSGYWEGDAGDMHRKNYDEQLDNIEFVLKRLHEHPVDLRVIAQKYSDTELKVEEAIIQALPGNVL